MVPHSVLAQISDNDQYHFGFNGQMKVNEWAGIGNHLEFRFRGYDSRTARFLSFDPVANKYPWYTPYQFAGNTPIQAIDLEGGEELKVTDRSAAFYGKVLIVIKNSQELKQLYSSISRPDRASTQLVYFSTTPRPSGGEHGLTTSGNIKQLAVGLVQFESLMESEGWKDVEDKDGKLARYNSNVAYFENLGVDYNEVAKAKQSEVYAVSINEEEVTKSFRGSTKTLAHEVVAHLKDVLNHSKKTGVQQHMDYYDIKKGDKDYVKYGIGERYSPDDKDAKPNSPAGKMNKLIDKTIDKTHPNEK